MKIYLPMESRMYCLTETEQKLYAKQYGVDVSFIVMICQGMTKDMEPQKTASKTIRMIHARIRETIIELDVHGD